jgi:hypothetical protein
MLLCDPNLMSTFISKLYIVKMYVENKNKFSLLSQDYLLKTSKALTFPYDELSPLFSFSHI